MPRPPSFIRRTGEAQPPGEGFGRCYIDSPYRPSSVCPEGQPLSRGMTATGSHIDSYSLRGAQPPGEGFFSVPAGFCVDFYCSNIVTWRIGACPRPYRATPGDFAPSHRSTANPPEQFTAPGNTDLHFSSCFSGVSAPSTGCSSTLGMKFRATLPFPLLFT